MGMVRAGILTLLAFGLVAGVVVALLPGSPPAESSGANTSAPTTPTATAASSTTSEIAMMNLQFSPAITTVPAGTKVTWTNHDTVAHTVTPVDSTLWGTEGSGKDPSQWIQPGQSWSWTFAKDGTYAYYCVPHGYKASDGTYKGMAGSVVVGAGGGSSPSPAAPALASNVTASIVPDPVAPKALTPGPDGMIHVELVAKEVTALLADGTSYTYWTFNGTVPGPMIRIHVGDTVQLTLRNDGTSLHTHSIDLHAVTGPGGGAKVTQTAPGNRTTFTFKALNPGLFVYHCASPPIPDHIASGMYGLILVEPQGGLPPVDKEYYVVQGEVYTNAPLGTKGDLGFDPTKVLAETPDYFTFNGRVGALTGNGSLTANVNDTVRIFFGVGGAIPSSFHVIGEIFDRVYLDGNDPASFNRQTVAIPAAGAATIEFRVDFPGSYTLVDHTLARAIDRGAVGSLVVTGWADPSIFRGTDTPGSGH